MERKRYRRDKYHLNLYEGNIIEFMYDNIKRTGMLIYNDSSMSFVVIYEPADDFNMIEVDNLDLSTVKKVI